MRRLSILLLSAILFTACDDVQNADIDDMLSTEEQKETTGDALHISDMKFSNDNKEMVLSVNLLHDIGDYDLMDSSKVVIRSLQEVQFLPDKYSKESQPVITKVSNPSREVLRELNLKLLFLVDLSLPEQQIDEELSAIKEIRAHFGHNQKGFYIAFMQGENVSESYELTDYILNNYFVHRDPSHIYLYRSILTKLEELSNDSTAIGNANKKVMIVMSGGKTYENDMPVDPQHFALQEVLADKATALKGMIWTYYANFSPGEGGNDGIMDLSDSGHDANILQYLCKDMNGIYQSSFNWHEMETDMLKDFNIDLSCFYVTMENPDGKIY